MHRYCAGISLTQFESTKTDPNDNDATPTFVCIVCSQQTNRSEIEELKNTIQDLQLEVRHLRDAIKRSTPDAEYKKSYAAASSPAKQEKEASKNKVIFKRKDKYRIRAKVGQRASCHSVSSTVVDILRRVWVRCSDKW